MADDRDKILTGVAKYFKLGGKGDRYKLVIDDVKLSKYFKDKVQAAVLNNKLNKKKMPIPNVQEEIRGKLIEIRFCGDDS